MACLSLNSLLYLHHSTMYRIVDSPFLGSKGSMLSFNYKDRFNGCLKYLVHCPGRCLWTTTMNSSAGHVLNVPKAQLNQENVTCLVSLEKPALVYRAIPKVHSVIFPGQARESNHTTIKWFILDYLKNIIYRLIYR